MRLWPWKAPLEERASNEGYTELLTNALLEQAAGSVVSTATAAKEIIASHYARAFASMMIQPAGPVADALRPHLSMIGRALIERGEVVLALDYDGGLRITPATFVQTYGDYRSWQYDVSLSGPSLYSTRRHVASSRVLHFRYDERPEQPWRGVSPFSGAASTATLLANLEQKLAQEASGPVGQVIAVPTGIDTGKLRADLSALMGKLGLAPTTAGGMGQGPMGAPRKDYEPQRLGANPPAALVELRRDVYRSILAAGGLNPALASGDAPASSLREFSREFKERVVAPLAGRMELEIAAKLDDVTLDLSRLHDTDLTHLAGAVDKLVSAGVPLDEAKAIAGL